MREIKLELIQKISKENLEKLRTLRNNKKISKFMINSNSITKQDHRNWLDKLTEDNSKKTFAIIENDNSIGSFYLTEIDYLEKSCMWGWYIDNDYSGDGLGTFVAFSCINFIFNNMKLDKQTVQVIENNKRAIKLYKNLSFVLDRGDTYQISKDNFKFNIYSYSLDKKRWTEYRNELKKDIKIDKYKINIII